VSRVRAWPRIEIRLRSTSARDATDSGLRWQARLIDSPPSQGSRAQGPGPRACSSLFLSPFALLSVVTIYSLDPWSSSSLAAPTGRAAAAPFVTSSPSLLRRQGSTRYARPSLSFRCARRSTPNPNKTISAA